MVGWRGAKEHVLHVVTAGGNAPRAAVSVPGRDFVRAGYRQAQEERNIGSSDCAHDGPAGSRDFWIGAAISAAGIPDRLSVGAMVGPVARGCAEHDWPLDDADGTAVLGSPDRTQLAPAVDRDFCRGGADDFAAHPSAMDHVAAEVAAVAPGVLRQRRAQPGHSAGMAVSYFSLDSVFLHRAGHRLLAAKREGTGTGNLYLRPCRSRWGRVDLRRTLDGPQFGSTLSRVRFLAHQPEFLSDSGGTAACDSPRSLRVVPVGGGARGIQPADPVRADIAAGVLGAY